MTNGIIIFYNVTYYPTNLGESRSVTTRVVNRTNTELLELLKFTNYTVFVQATTVALSEQSLSVTETTFEDGKILPTIVCTTLII